MLLEDSEALLESRSVVTWADNPRVEDRKVLLTGGEGSDGERAVGLGTAVDSSFCWRAGTPGSYMCTEKHFSSSQVNTGLN